MIQGDEIGCCDYGARFYDPGLGRWHVSDPAIEDNHYEWSPYSYVYNNPVMLIDPFGLDSAQLDAAIKKGLEYIEKNPGDSYKLSEKGEPGEDTDCSGMTSGCIVAGGEKDPVRNPENRKRAIERFGEDGGVKRTAVGTTEITYLPDVKPGMLVAFDDHSHIGVVSNIELNSEGEIYNLQYMDSGGISGSGNSGPRFSSAISNGENMGKTISGFYKWDKKVDLVRISLPVVQRDNTMVQGFKFVQ